MTDNVKKEKYTIMFSVFREGSITEIVNKEKVRSECERLKNLYESVENFNKKIGDYTHTYCKIEVVNNNTGEIREYWNSHNNKIEFLADVTQRAAVNSGNT